MANVVNTQGVTPMAAAVPSGPMGVGQPRAQINPPQPGSAAVTTLGLPLVGQTFQGMTVTPWIDVGPGTYVAAQLDITRSVPKGTLAVLANSAAGSFQAEFSGDGNGGVLQTGAVALAQNTEHSVVFPAPSTSYVTGKMMRMVKYRFVPTSTVTVEGTLLTPPTSPQGNVQTMAYTVDGLGFAIGSASSTFLDAYPYTDSTTPLGTKTAATALGAAPNQCRFCPYPLTGLTLGGVSYGPTPGSNQYYLASATGATLVITPLTAPAMTFGANNIITGIVPTVAKSVSWHPGITSPRTNGLGASVQCPPGYFCAVGGTTGMSIVAFNPQNGTVGQIMSLSNVANVGNITCLEFSPDGNFLMVGGATSPYLTILPVYVTGSLAAGFTLNLDKAIPAPTIVPNAALIACKWHPTMEQIFYVTGTSTYLFGQAFYFNTAGAKIPTGQYALFGGKVPCPTPTGAPAAFPDCLAISPDGGWLGFAASSNIASTFHAVYSIGDPMTGVGAAATLVAGATGQTTATSIVWHPNNQTIITGGATSLFISIYPWLVGVDTAITVQANTTN